MKGNLKKSIRYLLPLHLLSSLCNWFTSWLRYGKQWGYPDYRRFLPPLFTAMPGIAALFTQARSGKLWIPHPHGTCIMGYRGQGFLGEFSLTQTWKNVMFNEQHHAVKQSDLAFCCLMFWLKSSCWCDADESVHEESGSTTYWVWEL